MNFKKPLVLLLVLNNLKVDCVLVFRYEIVKNSQVVGLFEFQSEYLTSTFEIKVLSPTLET